MEVIHGQRVLIHLVATRRGEQELHSELQRQHILRTIECGCIGVGQRRIEMSFERGGKPQPLIRDGIGSQVLTDRPERRMNALGRGHFVVLLIVAHER